MPGYENAPATRMLATFCAVCRRPLVDAVSVDTGIGPDCRKKYGFDVVVDEAARAEANAIVYQVALDGHGLGAALAAERLRALGFEKLAEVLLKRSAPIRIVVDGDRLEVKSPWNESALSEFRRIPGRRWIADKKVNTFPCDRKPELLTALRRVFFGMVAYGPKGPFVIAPWVQS